METSLITEEIITELLEEAKIAHKDYEQELGHEDPDWITFYASYIADRLQDM